MPRLAASSSLVVYPGGGMMPSMSVAASPASAMAVSVACEDQLDGRNGRAAQVVGLADSDDRRSSPEAVLVPVHESVKLAR